MQRSGAGHCEVKGQLGLEKRRISEEGLKEAPRGRWEEEGGRRVGGCCDGGMLLNIFSVDGEQGQGRKNGPPKLVPLLLELIIWTTPRDEIM